MKNDNLVLNSDSYKQSHFKMYHPDVTHVYSYIESRGGKYPKTLFFGLQMFLKEYLTKPITQEMIDEAEVFLKLHGEPFNRGGWEYILKAHNGYLPLEIRAVPEGTVVPVLHPLVTIVNTDRKCAWLTSFIETSLLRGCWYATTVATVSWYIKQNIKTYLEETSDTLDSLPFGLLDFSARGCTSYESNAIGGVGHLVSFLGTDSIGAVLHAKDMYHADMAGFSVPASEHSVMCSWGHENELESFKHILETTKNFPIVSVVSDSWNIYEACDKWCLLANDIKNQNRTLVVRPDSGDYAQVLPIMYETLANGFGYTVNSKGYKVLSNVKILWGDGIEPSTITPILDVVKSCGFSTETILLGSGGGLLQKVDRDTQKFAYKASAVKVNGMWKDVFKSPVDDPGKVSKKGRVTLYKDLSTGEFYTGNVEPNVSDELVTVYKNGKLFKDWTLDEVRERSIVGL